MSDAEPFDELDRTLKDSGPAAALDRLIGLLDGRGEYRALLDALLLKARHDLGLPLIQDGGLSDLSEPARTEYENRYVEAIRSVGRRLLEAGDIPAAWPYYRAIAEPNPIAEALEAASPAQGDEQVGALVEVAFNQGAHPRKGFELILDHFGPCSAISAFEHLPNDDSTRIPSADRLVRCIHEQLTGSLRAEIARRGQPAPAEGASIPALLAGRDWLFDDEAYHIDVSHLASTVRLSPILTDPASIALALELAEYGRRLSDRYSFDGEPPFESIYDDHAVYLRALLRRDVEEAIAHFRSKLTPPAADGSIHPADSLPAQVLVRFLVRLGRPEQAIDVAADHLAGLPESALLCPGLAPLCQRAGLPDRLARASRSRGDLVNYAAAILQWDRTAGS